VYPFRFTQDGVRYAILRRGDAGFWQGIAGGAQDSETPLEAARRESPRRAGIDASAAFLALDSRVHVRRTSFSDTAHWDPDLLVVPQYAYGVEVTDPHLTLSSEHTEYQWLPYQGAHDLVRFDGNKNALWNWISDSEDTEGHDPERRRIVHSQKRMAQADPGRGWRALQWAWGNRLAPGFRPSVSQKQTFTWRDEP